MRGLRTGTSWTACIDPDDDHPEDIKRSPFWSDTRDDAVSWSSPEEAQAAAKRAS